jgi:mRNA interferase MazF
VNAPLSRGSLVWVDLNPTRGREQAGSRPAVVIAADSYLDAVPELAVVLPITSTDRGWVHHVRITGQNITLAKDSFAMTEQPRTIDRSRISRRAGIADDRTMREIDGWLHDFLNL